MEIFLREFFYDRAISQQNFCKKTEAKRKTKRVVNPWEVSHPLQRSFTLYQHFKMCFEAMAFIFIQPLCTYQIFKRIRNLYLTKTIADKDIKDC